MSQSQIIALYQVQTTAIWRRAWVYVERWSFAPNGQVFCDGKEVVLPLLREVSHVNIR